MATDYIAAVAGWLSDQGTDMHRLGALGQVVDDTTPDRKRELDAVYAAVERLDILGLVDFHHHVAMAVVTVRHRAGLRRLAAGEPLALVAEDVERDRPVSILRIRGGWAAWYLSTLRLPAGAGVTGVGGQLAATPDDALAALRHHVQVTAAVEWAIADRDRGRPVR